VKFEDLVFELVSVKEKRIEKIRLYLPTEQKEEI
jgi:hypothetical protein